MKLIEPYYRPLVNYQGAVHVDIGDGSQAEGYFEAVQAFDGTIAIGCFFNKFVPIEPGIVKLNIEATDKGGWKLHPEGQVVSPGCSIHSIHGTSMTTVIVHPARLRAMRVPDRSLCYLGTRFVVANFVFDQFCTATPPPVCLSVEGHDIEICPSKTYLEQATRLRAMPGIEITASVEMKTSNGVRHSLDEVAKLMDSLISVLRLWSGNKLDWIYGEGLDDSSQDSLEVLHKHSVVRDFSNTFHSLGWQIDLKELVEAFFSTGPKPLDIQTIKEFVNYFVDVCARGPYLEIRALSAATLLDALTLKYAIASGEQNILSDTDFQREVLPRLAEAIASSSLDGTIKGQLKNNLRGLYRASFRRRLKLLNEKLSLQMDKKLVDRVKEARDTLVHEGRLIGTTNEDRFADYRALLWTDFCALCRLVGYGGGLPPLKS